MTLFVIYAPLRASNVNQCQHLWIAYNIKQLIQRRGEINAVARIIGNDSKKSYYRELKQIYNGVFYSEKKAYYNHYVNNQKDPRVLWIHIKIKVI